ncbi:MAG: tyrosine-type recombinase/integrase, partial [Candidatus Omnitrophica bacterium]|nr:tyrosine-type recombinase/integrase [Candidatus Omnitrophota bacterium]
MRAFFYHFRHLANKLKFDNEDDFVFVSDARTPLSKRAIQKSFKRCIKVTGLSEKHSIHCLRHTYATYLLKASRNIKLVKEQLGHSSIKTTEIYISLIKEDTKEALKNLYKVERPFIKTASLLRS